MTTNNTKVTIELPCEIGSTIYVVFKKRARPNGKGYWRIQKSRLTYTNMERVIRDFGTYVFTLRLYAEKRRKELQENEP